MKGFSYREAPVNKPDDEEQEDKTRERLEREVKGMKEEDKQATHRRHAESNLKIEVRLQKMLERGWEREDGQM